MLYAKLSNVYSKGDNKIVRYDVTGEPAEISAYLEEFPKSVDSVTGKPIYNQTIRPDSKVKTYSCHGSKVIGSPFSFKPSRNFLTSSMRLGPLSGAFCKRGFVAPLRLAIFDSPR